MKIGKFKKIAAIGLALTMAIGLLYTSGTVNATDDNKKKDLTPEGVELNKTATSNNDGTYNITLDAFSTGYTETINKTVPTDIILVLDQSGSMQDNFTIEGGQYFVEYSNSDILSIIQDLLGVDFNCVSMNGTAYKRKDNLYYSPDQVNYYKVEVTRKGGLGGVGSNYIYKWTDSNGEQQEVVSSGFTSLTDHIPSPLYGNLYRTVTEVNRLDALKNSVSTFVNKVAENALGPDGIAGTADDISHRISIIGFGSGESDYQNSELFIGDQEIRYDRISNDNYQNAFQSVLTQNGIQNIYSAINSLDAEGATHIDLGMKMAENVLEHNPIDANTERSQAVIVFTDGVPGDYDTDLDSTKNRYANAALESAYDIKKDGVQMFSVGIFDGADDKQPVDTTVSDWDDAKTANRFMNYLSSNYPNAISMSNGGTRSSSNYYFSANEAQKLNEIFETISDDIYNPIISLDSNTMIKDYMSNYFVIDDTIPVIIKSVNCSSESEGIYRFEGDEEILSQEDISVIVSDDKKSISVTGYDFNENLVSGSDNDVAGSKLVITFTVKPIDGFIGGNNVPTNNQSNSGIYLPNSDEPLGRFPLPTVNVPLKYDFLVEDQGMYVAREWNNIAKFFKLGDDNLPKYKIGDNYYSLSQNYVNDFVDITYEIYGDEDLTEKVASYKIDHNKEITINTENFSSESFDASKVFYVKVCINDINDSNNKLNTNAKNVNLYVFVPKIQTEDDILFLNDDDVELNDYVEFSEWYCNELKDDPSMENKIIQSMEEVDLAYSFKLNGVDASTFSPDEIGMNEVSVFIEYSDTGEDITKYTISNHNDILNNCDNLNCIKPHYFLKVEAGSITITKSFDNANYDYTDGNPIFIFKVTDDNGNSYYQNVKFEKSDENDKLVGVIEGLGAGRYQIKELESLRFKETNFGWSYKDNVYTSQNKEITLSKENKNAYAKFTNKVKSSKYDSDNDIIVNEFTRNDDGSISWNGKNLSVKE